MIEMLKNHLSVDLILSDWMLLSGVLIFALSSLFVLFCLIKLLTFRQKESRKFVVPREEAPTPIESSPIEPEPEPEPEQAAPPPPPRPSPKRMADPEKTVVISAAESDIQAQLDIVITQMKNLNKKISELEDRIDDVASKQNDHPAPSSEASSTSRPPIMPL